MMVFGMLKRIKEALNKCIMRYKIRHIKYRPYDYIWDMYYDEFEDASDEDIEIYLTQMKNSDNIL